MIRYMYSRKWYTQIKSWNSNRQQKAIKFQRSSRYLESGYFYICKHSPKEFRSNYMKMAAYYTSCWWDEHLSEIQDIDSVYPHRVNVYCVIYPSVIWAWSSLYSHVPSNYSIRISILKCIYDVGIYTLYRGTIKDIRIRRIPTNCGIFVCLFGGKNLFAFSPCLVDEHFAHL